MSSDSGWPWNTFGNSSKEDDPWTNNHPGSFFGRRSGGWFGGGGGRNNDPFGDIDQISREMDEIFSSLFSGGMPFDGGQGFEGGPDGNRHGSVRIIMPGNNNHNGDGPGGLPPGLFGAGPGGRGGGGGGPFGDQNKLPPLSAINPALGDPETSGGSDNHRDSDRRRNNDDGRNGYFRQSSGPGWSISSWSSSSRGRRGPWDGDGGGGGGGGNCVLCEKLHRHFFSSFFEPEKDRPLLGRVNPKYTEHHGSDQYFSDGSHDGFRDPNERRSVFAGDGMINPFELLFGSAFPFGMGPTRDGGGGGPSGDHNPSIPLPTSPYRPHWNAAEKELPPMESYYSSSSMTMSTTADGKVIKKTMYRDTEGNVTEKEEILNGDDMGGELDWFGGGGRNNNRRNDSVSKKKSIYDVVRKDSSYGGSDSFVDDRHSSNGSGSPGLNDIVAIPSQSHSMSRDVSKQRKRSDDTAASYDSREREENSYSDSHVRPSSRLRDFASRFSSDTGGSFFRR